MYGISSAALRDSGVCSTRHFLPQRYQMNRVKCKSCKSAPLTRRAGASLPHPCYDRPAPVRGTKRAAEISSFAPPTDFFGTHDLRQNPPRNAFWKGKPIGIAATTFFHYHLLSLLHDAVSPKNILSRTLSCLSQAGESWCLRCLGQVWLAET